MEFQVGQTFSILFKIDDDVILSTASFTGDIVTIGNDTIYLCTLASGKEYGFTQAKLSQFRSLNDPANRQQADSITM